MHNNEMVMINVQRKKLVHLESLRGLATISVLFTHIRDDFFNDHVILLNNLLGDWKVINRACTAIMHFIFHTGELSVHLFWILSGYVISLRYLKQRNEGFSEELSSILRQSVAARYFRLFLPVFAISIMVYCLAKFGLLKNNELTQILGKSITDTHKYYVDFNPTIIDTIRFSFWDCPILMQSFFNPPLWTISYELWGSFLVYAILFFYGKHNSRYLVYCISILFLFLVKSYFASFLIGLLLSDLNQSNSCLNGILRNRIVVHKILFFSLWLYSILIWSGFPVIDHLFVSILKLPPVDSLLSCVAILIIVDFGPKWFINLLYHRYLLFIGRISYGIYLIHQPVLCSLGIAIFISLYKELNSRFLATFLATLISIPFIVFSGWIFYKTIDIPSVRFSKYFGRMF